MAREIREKLKHEVFRLRRAPLKMTGRGSVEDFLIVPVEFVTDRTDLRFALSFNGEFAETERR